MTKRIITLPIIIFLVIISYCTRINYIGSSYEPTSEIDLYYSKHDIEKDYEIIGHAIGTGDVFVSNEKIVRKLVEEAKGKGADAILLTGLDKWKISLDDFDVDEKKVVASFLKYK